MSHVEPRSRTDVPALASVFSGAEATMGFVPNSMLTMAHMPQLPVAFMMLVNVVFGGDLETVMEQMRTQVPQLDDADAGLAPGLEQLIAFACSVSAGCRYCQAHTSHNAHRMGEDQAKFDDVLNFETSAAYNDSERAVVGLALAAGAVPNEAAPQHFERLRDHFSERQIVQIVAVIAMFGFLNRWNDTMATQLEEPAVDYASGALDAIGWQLGKHG
ncbi:MAG: carboxymuconolactone decarboxylase family protein [Pseudomonadales bacterium]